MSNNYIDQLKQIMSVESLSQIQLADRLDVTFAALNRWINGHARPRSSKIIAIRKLFQEIAGYPSVTAKDQTLAIQQAQAMKRKELWDFIARHQELQDELLLEHTYNSTSIEGTTFNKRETEAVIFSKAVIPDKSLVEHLEVTNHAAALRRILNKRSVGPLTEGFIKDLHKELLHGVRGDGGQYSKHQRAIRGVQIHLTHPDDIPEEIGQLLRTWKKMPNKTIKEISDFHVQFELIHPFGDGNGRIGRLLMVVQCLQQGYPPVVIENSRKGEYYDVLEYAQRRSVAPFVLFVVDEMKKTAAIIRKYQ